MGNHDQHSSALRLVRVRAMFALFWERLWPLLFPLVCVIALFLAFTLAGFWAYLPLFLRYVVLSGFGLAGIAALWPLRQMVWPSAGEVDHRVETASQLSHRPVTAVSDRQADLSGGQDPLTQALWNANRRRAEESLSNLRGGLPVPAVAQRDPFALRAVPLLLLFVAAGMGWGQWGERMGQILTPSGQTSDTAGRLDAWIAPPAYTGRPPVFLNRNGERVALKDAESLKVPEGSEFKLTLVDAPEAQLTVLGVGDDGMVRKVDADTDAERDDEARKTAAAKDRRQSFTLTVEKPVMLELRQDGTLLETWRFDVTPDRDPSIAFATEPAASTTGALEFSYVLDDDYGIATAHARIVPEGSHAAARPLVVPPDFPLSAPGRLQKPGTFSANRDFSSHPYAGGRVMMHLEASDHAGQTATSKTRTFVLPGRIFTKPLAKALIFERRRLAMDAKQARSVATMLDIISSTHPDKLIPDVAHYMALRVAFRHIRRARDDDALRDGLEQLWALAVAIEDGDLSDAERRLREAQERLAEALERGASDEEIERLMQELRQAMNEFLREMARRMEQSPNQQAQRDLDLPMMRQQDLDRLMQQIEDLAKSGSQDAARELLRQLQEMMNNLQQAQPGQPRQQDPFSEQMNRLGEMMRRQQELMDETFSMQRRQQQMQRQQQQGQQGQQNQQQQQQGQQQQGQQGQQGEQRPMTPEEFAEAMRRLQEQQGALQEKLQQLQEAMRELGLQPGEQMGEAGEAMGEAEGNLGEGQTGQATENQGRALEAMREGAQRMMRDMQQQAGEQGRQGERGRHGEQTRGDQDPLGRPSRSRGPQFGNDTKVPDEIDAQRAREILEIIRRRLGETARPKLELDYLDRLLPSR